MLRLGFGADSHRLIAGDGLRLGGIKIAATVAAVAHSDGDTLMHAIVDAIFGALSLGDIGDHFPDAAESNRGRASSEFLLAARNLMRGRGYAIQNLDTTIFLEQPKLSAYKRQIAENLARLLEIPPDAVSVKAKTGEQFGAIGECQMIAAQAAILLMRMA